MTFVARHLAHTPTPIFNLENNIAPATLGLLELPFAIGLSFFHSFTY
jgi:hypothetical protein